MKDIDNSKLSNAVRNRSEIAEIKRRYDTGEISREEAKRLTQPVLDRINAATRLKTAELNKKYGMNRSPGLLDFTGLMRNDY